jgi:outer membrane protein assembly factor BamB
VANGVVYVGAAFNGLLAFSSTGTANCSGSPKTCTQLWRGNVGSFGIAVSSPAVATGVVYAGSQGGLVAFGP